MFNYAAIQDVVEKLIKVGMVRSAYNVAMDHKLYNMAEELLQMVEGPYELDDNGKIK